MEPSKLNKIIHERVRLAVMSALVARETITFNEMKSLLKVTDGNLSVHTGILEKHNLLAITKDFVGKKPRTTFHITKEGRKAFEAYLEQLGNMLKGPG
jgi:DNA-binding MarR family transcriptional regulator